MRLLPCFRVHSADRFGLAIAWLVAGCMLSFGCAHRPSIAPDVTEARSEITRLESNIASRRSQIPIVASGSLSAHAVPAMSPSAAQSAPAGRCDGVCVAAQSICGYSRRICTLSEKIADEPSQRSCKNAERECSDASSQCASCR